MLKLFFFKRFFLDSDDKLFYDKISRMINLRLKNIVLYKIAFQHKSSDLEHYSNERLEFLGDAVLSSIVADYLFKKYPLENEGFLTEIRSRIVNRESLGFIARKMGLDLLLQYGNSNGRSRHVYGNTLEALVGAVCLDRGYLHCYNFVIHQLVHKYIDLKYIIENDTNYKSAILEWASKNNKNITFEFKNTTEASDVRGFHTQVFIDNEFICTGDGISKKQSEQNASRKALEALNLK